MQCIKMEWINYGKETIGGDPFDESLGTSE